MKKSRNLLRKKTKISIAVIIVLVIICIVVPVSVMISKDNKDSVQPPFHEATLLQYFNLTDGLDIVWAHAVNSHKHLLDALNDTKILMLEADVSMNSAGVPIMAHPPKTTSDITLESWLDIVFSYQKKGIKLDFKSTAVLPEALAVCHKVFHKYNEINLPVILNADILKGPNEIFKVPVNPIKFIHASLSVKSAILSPGWTTEFIGNSSAGYTWETVREMNELMSGVSRYVTFPIRASLVSRSLQQLIWLIHQNPQCYTLTIWTSKMDNFDIKELKPLRKYHTQVYYDLPDNEIQVLQSL